MSNQEDFEVEDEDEDDLSIDTLQSRIAEIDDEIRGLEAERRDYETQLWQKRDKPIFEAQKKLERWTKLVSS